MEQTTNKHTMQFSKLYSHNLVIQILLITLTALLSCDRCLTISHSQVSKRHTWNQSCTTRLKNNDYINIEVMALGMQSKEHGANIQMFNSMENYVSLLYKQDIATKYNNQLPLRKNTGVVENFGFCITFSSTLD